MNKKQDLSEMINAMFGECDSEVARLLIEIFEVVKDSEPQELKCTCGQTREAGEIPSAFTGVPPSKYKLCAVHGVPRWKGKPEPQKIQGYTAEQWQEIIDGGYLCEARDGEGGEWVPIMLDNVSSDDEHGMPFWDNVNDPWTNCRPAQIKGVMRPIFVEPVDKTVTCHFFDKTGTHLGTAYPWEDYSKMKNHGLSCSAQYIEI